MSFIEPIAFSNSLAKEIYSWTEDLFPICRSLTGEGVRQTLRYIENLLPGLNIREIASGTKVFDWEIPKEWNVKEAFVEDEDGRRIVCFEQNNLHLLGYSTPVDQWVTLSELEEHLYSIENQPDVIPYRTSYYAPNWGFCISQRQRNSLKAKKYRVVINTSLTNGVLNYGEYIIPGETSDEILFSTYVCHPSMANNELSGPVVATALARKIAQEKAEKNIRFRHTFRFVFVPETIGSIAYISRNIEELQANVKAGFVLTCLGDNGDFSLINSRSADTLADSVADHVLKNRTDSFKRYSFLERGSDERQYCSVGVDLPVCSITRSKYGTFPEYHTSLDDLNFVSGENLLASLKIYGDLIYCLENNFVIKTTTLCEPQLGKRGLYPVINTPDSKNQVRLLTDILAYADGQTSLIEIAEVLNTNIWEVAVVAAKLLEHGLLEIRD